MFISRTMKKVETVMKNSGRLLWIPNIRKAWNKAQENKYIHKKSWDEFILRLISLMDDNDMSPCDEWDCSRCINKKRTREKSRKALVKYRFSYNPNLGPRNSYIAGMGNSVVGVPKLLNIQKTRRVGRKIMEIS